MDDNKDDHPAEEFATLGPETDDGQLIIRHKADHTIELAELRPLEDGKPIDQDVEIVKLTGEGPQYKIETLYKPDESTRKGPAKVSTPRYKSGWDTLWGDKSKVLN